MLLLIEFLSNKNSNRSIIDSKFQRKQNILLRFLIFAIKKKDIKFCVNHHSKFMVIEYAYSSIVY